MLKRFVVLVVVVLSLTLLLSTITTLSAWVAVGPREPGSPAQSKALLSTALGDGRGDGGALDGKARDVLASLPLRFVPNVGQGDAEVQYGVHGAGQALFFSADQVLFEMDSAWDAEEDAEAARVGGRWPAAYASGGFASGAEPGVVKLRFAGANPEPTVEGVAPLAGVVNYFLGSDPGQWRANVPTYGALAYRGLYPGIDLVYWGSEGHLKSEFVVAPGADPGVIEMAYYGVGEAWLREDGALVLQTAWGQIVEEAPLIYQEADGERVPVPGGYVLRPASTGPYPSKEVSVCRARFWLGEYDPEQGLVIDPSIEYSTYLGGSGYDQAEDVAVDGDGNAFVTGYTESNNFPTWAPIQATRAGGRDVFVTEIISAAGAYTYGYSTYLGGSDDDEGRSIALDPEGSAYVAGKTHSSDFPTTTNAIDGDLGGSNDAFVTKIISTSGGYTLGLSTYLGGSGTPTSSSSDSGYAIAVDGVDRMWVAGATGCEDFPAKDPLRACKLYDSNAFVTRIISASGQYTYSFSTCLGGTTAQDSAHAVAADGSGGVYVGGNTLSTDFPTTTNALQMSWAGNFDGFVTRIVTGSGAYTYGFSTYLGGGGEDQPQDIAVDSDGNAYVTGYTFSTDFPTTTNAIDGNLSGGLDAFVTQIISASGGYTYAYSSYLGGTHTEEGFGIAVHRGAIYVAGLTSSLDFPTTTNAIQGYLAHGSAGVMDVFVTKIVSTSGGYTYSFSSYFGGGWHDSGFGVALDGEGNPYVVGRTESDPTEYPQPWPLVRAADTQCETTSPREGFVFKFDLTPQVTDHRPSQQAVGVAVTSPITLAFDSTMDPSTVNSHTLFVHGHLTGIFTDSYSYDGASETLTFTPTRAYHTGEVVRLHATGGISDIGGAALQPYGWEFTAGPVVSRCFGGFTDVSAAAAITGGTHAGLAWGDYDNDGDLDVLLTGLAPGGPRLAGVYRNNGDGTFTDIAAGLTGVSEGMVAWGDYDNDGDLDLVLCGIDNSSNELCAVYRNDGAGTFTDIVAGLLGIRGGSAVWGDLDNDGDLDLLLTGYDGSSGRTKLYRNDGGAFTDVAGTGLAGAAESAAALGDADNDGDLDVLLSGNAGSPGSPNPFARVYRNDGSLTFTDVGAGLLGVRDSGADWGDYDNDGDVDLLLAGEDVTGTAVSRVYRNDGPATFTDIGAGLVGVYESSASWGDVDNDGDLDILLTGRRTAVSSSSKVYRNDGGGVFTDISAGLQGVADVSAVWGDYDNDGDLDILMGYRPFCKLYRNDDCPDLELVKQGEPATMDVGGDITYTLSFTNAGSGPASGVWITDIVPITVTQLAYQSSLYITPTGSVSYAWQVQDLAPGQRGFITLTGVISRWCNPTSNTFDNVAAITSTQVDAQPLDNEDDATTWVNATVAPTVTFAASPLSCCAPLTVYFSDTPTAGSAQIVAWYWTFGDGGTAAISRTSHVYSGGGSYTVTLTVTDSNGCSGTLVRTDYIAAHGVAASFDLSPSSGCPPLTVYVSDTSTASPGSVAAWQWDYGDGVGSSTAQNPAPYSYSSPGSYTVTLTVTDSHGCSSSVQHAVTVSVCLEVDKYDLQDPVTASWRIRYRIRVRNTSLTAYATVLVTDTLPPGTYFLPLLAENAGWFDGGGFVTRPIHSLLGGSEVTLDLVLGTHSTASGTVTNRAEARWSDTTVADEETTTIQPRPAPLPTPTPTPKPGPGTVVEIQTGVGNDNPDTFIYRYAADTNYHLNPLLRVGYRQLFQSLLRFDLSAIAAGATVDEARLELYAPGWGGADITIGAYAISNTVTISETTWNRPHSGDWWGWPGANDTLSDRRAQSEDVVTTAGPLKWYGFDLTALAQEWVNGMPNEGVLLRQEVYAPFAFFFASSEYADVALRPRLVVRYQ